MKRKYSMIIVLTALVCVLMYPYLVRDLLPVEHDTFFHLSRIENLSLAIRAGNFLPAVYPEENGGFGYASPLFYSDVLLIPAALLHLAGLPLTVCYKSAVFAAVWLSAFTMYRFAGRVFRSPSVQLTAAAAYLFSNYRITDIYVRGALGEVFAFAFLPVILSGMYEVLYRKDAGKWPLLTAGLSLLALSHNLTFLMGSVLCALLYLIFIGKADREVIAALAKGVGTAFLLTAFFTLPMIEQLRSQDLIVSHYAGSSSLAKYAMTLPQYFVNRTVFGLAGNDRPLNETMIENIGLFLTFVPVLYFFADKEKKNGYITALTILGYICMFLPSALLPWQRMGILGIMQFPWRFNTMAMLLLSVPAAAAAVSLLKKPALTAVLLLVLSGECVWHVTPVLSRTFGMDSRMTWQDVLDGALCDPYYSAFYVRVELAGGDYLPAASCDFREQPKEITAEDGTLTGIPFYRSGSVMTFSLNEDRQTYILPLTWYRGYHVYRSADGKLTEVPSFPSAKALVSFRAEGAGQYICMYEDTLIRRINMSLSAMTLGLLFLYFFRKKR